MPFMVLDAANRRHTAVKIDILISITIFHYTQATHSTALLSFWRWCVQNQSVSAVSIMATDLCDLEKRKDIKSHGNVLLNLSNTRMIGSVIVFSGIPNRPRSFQHEHSELPHPFLHASVSFEFTGRYNLDAGLVPPVNITKETGDL
jgi:hypothetical protein